MMEQVATIYYLQLLEEDMEIRLSFATTTGSTFLRTRGKQTCPTFLPRPSTRPRPKHALKEAKRESVQRENANLRLSRISRIITCVVRPKRTSKNTDEI